jgi:TRAP-type mannitol/chloroaromatic compound transport system permease small subunit
LARPASLGRSARPYNPASPGEPGATARRKGTVQEAAARPNDSVPGRDPQVNGLLAFSRAVDALNERVGKAMTWLILIVVIISAGNAVVRYAIDYSNNGLLVIQWYLFSAVFLLMSGYVLKRNEHIRIDILAGRTSARTQNWIDVFGFVVFLLCAGYVLEKNEHIRIDVIFGRFSPRTQNWIDVFGFLAFFLPMVGLTLWLSWPVFMNAWTSGEMSANPGVLVRWPVRLLLPVGFLLLLLQGLSELVKRVAFLSDRGPNALDKRKGPSAEEELAAEIKKHQVAAEVTDIVGMADDMVRGNGAQGRRK